MDIREGRFFVWAALGVCGLVLNSFAADLVTLSGRQYKNYEVRKITDHSVEIGHDAGFSSIPFDELPKKFLRENPEAAEKINEIHTRKQAEEKAEKEKQEREHQQRLQKIQKSAYEKARRELFLKALFLPPLPENAARKKEKIDILSNILFVEGDNGGGTAFKMRFGRENVIVSNAHVYLELVRPRIHDAYGNRYKIEAVISSVNRDLVILKYRSFREETPVLKMAEAVTSIPVNSSIVAYGNSQGDNVNTTLPGKLLGVGYDIIEVSSGIVPGNSGGPVVLNGTGQVIGVSTYMKIRRTTAQTAGTRFGSTSFLNPYAVRRFATRIDNLKMEDLEVLPQSELISDRQCLQGVGQMVDQISEILNSSKIGADAAYSSLQAYLQETGPWLQKADSHHWVSSYLSREYKKKRNYLQSYFKALRIGDPILASRLADIWKHAGVRVRTVNIPTHTRDCPKCNGSGRIRQNPFGLSISKGEAFKNAYKTCSYCHGTGKITVEEAGTKQEYTISNSALRQFNQCIEKSKRRFNGFDIGGYASEELRRSGYYNRNHLFDKDLSELVKTYTYKGNHRIHEALYTRFSFVFGRLLEVVIVLPNTPRLRQFFEKFIKDNFSDLDDVYEVRCKAKGNQLFIFCIHDAYTPLARLSAGTSSDGKSLL